MSTVFIKARGRSFSKNDILLIKNIIRQNTDYGRTQISRVICEQLKWFQPNGWLKDRACRDVLLHLAAKNLIKLPPPKVKKNMSLKKERPSPFKDCARESINSGDINKLTIAMVRHTKYEKDWNDLVSKYHYLGHKIIVGRHLKYMAFLDDAPVACLGWGDAAWAVSCRDNWIGWDKQQREKNIHTIINNVRFLIFPWVKIPNLASKVLSINIKQLVNDWNNFYKVKPVLLETFVEQDRFQGTCYKAANWLDIGLTRGTSKRGNFHLIHNNIKRVFVYPAEKKCKEMLCN